MKDFLKLFISNYNSRIVRGELHGLSRELWREIREVPFRFEPRPVGGRDLLLLELEETTTHFPQNDENETENVPKKDWTRQLFSWDRPLAYRLSGVKHGGSSVKTGSKFWSSSSSTRGGQ